MFLDALDELALRALLQDLGKRLIRESSAYHEGMEKRKSVVLENAFAYFGLTAETASLADASAAYKKKARAMHPDKNGGRTVVLSS